MSRAGRARALAVAAALALVAGVPTVAAGDVTPPLPTPELPSPQLPEVPAPPLPTPSPPAPTPEAPSLPAPPPLPAPPTQPVPSAPPTPTTPSLPPSPVPVPTAPGPTAPAPSLPGGTSPSIATPSASGSDPAVSSGSGPGSTRAAPAAGAERPGRAGASESSSPGPGARAEARTLDAVARVAAACRAAGRLLATRSGGSGTAPPASSSGASAAGEPVGAMAVSLLAGEHALVSPADVDVPRGGDGAEDPPSVAAGLVDLTPRDVSVLAAVAVGMLLLAVTALAAYALADGAAGGRRRTLLGGVRAALHDPVRRTDAKAVLVLVVVSLAIWSAIAIWLLTRGG